MVKAEPTYNVSNCNFDARGTPVSDRAAGALEAAARAAEANAKALEQIAKSLAGTPGNIGTGIYIGNRD